MGMFDYLRCDYPLPDDGANAIQFQTKDLECTNMDNYWVKEDGTLWKGTGSTHKYERQQHEGVVHICGSPAHEPDIRFSYLLVFWGDTLHHVYKLDSNSRQVESLDDAMNRAISLLYTAEQNMGEARKIIQKHQAMRDDADWHE